MKNDDLVSGLNEKGIYSGWTKLPKRIYLDTNIVQLLYNFGGYI